VRTAMQYQRMDTRVGQNDLQTITRCRITGKYCLNIFFQIFFDAGKCFEQFGWH